MSQTQATQGISVVTTTWNEKENIEELIYRIRKTLQTVPHEVIVVDDSSSDGTLEVAKRFADVAVGKVREGQTKGLLYGAKIAKYPVIVTIDSDLENSPELIPALVEKLGVYDVVVASRTLLPRFSERWAARTVRQENWGFRFLLQFQSLQEGNNFQRQLEGRRNIRRRIAGRR